MEINLIKESCLNGKCIYDCINDDTHERIIEKDSLKQILETLHLNSKLRPHYPCVVKLVNVSLHQNFNTSVTDFEAYSDAETIEILTTLCLLPDVCYPLKLQHDSTDNEEFETNHKLNPKLSYQCLLCCKTILFERKVDSESILKYQKRLLKKVAPYLVLLISSRLGNFSWCTNELTKECNEILQFICKVTKHETVKSLFAGDVENSNVLFPRGIFGFALEKLSLVFTKDNWRKNLPWKHSLIWCATKVSFPCLGEYLPHFIPFLLLMVDDLVEDNKICGFSTLLYVMHNVTASDLNLYNYGKVIYDALFQQLFSNSDRLYEIVLPCLNKVLQILEKGNIVHPNWTLWDTTLEKIIHNLEFSNRIKTRRLFLKYLPMFLNEMGANCMKHLESLFKALQFVAQFVDIEGEQTRLLVLNAYQKVIRHCWIALKRHHKQLLKTHTKLYLDIKFSGILKNDKILNELLTQNLILLRSSCGEEFDKSLKEMTALEMDEPHSKALQSLIRSVINVDLDKFDLSSIKLT
ncbi:TELO2-interacting protein 2-like [Clytia hemisphaerica]|uniref:TELO2-interacting protein 2-like n=1 Tax=Clytia hemisphaerica TaxID=252671 RepID=UPI0034D5C4FE|eukprot:TCONS_00052541-protein